MWEEKRKDRKGNKARREERGMERKRKEERERERERGRARERKGGKGRWCLVTLGSLAGLLMYGHEKKAVRKEGGMFYSAFLWCTGRWPEYGNGPSVCVCVCVCVLCVCTGCVCTVCTVRVMCVCERCANGYIGVLSVPYVHCSGVSSCVFYVCT